MSDGKSPRPPEPTRIERPDAKPHLATVLENAPAAEVAGGTRLESADDIRRAAAELRPAASPGHSPPPRDATRMESADEVRQAVAAIRAVASPSTASPFRPVRRPPMARLTIRDDASGTGEVVRLRAERTVIGRTEGDIKIPHDGMMSSRHAEIVREADRDGWRWSLVNLSSTNGSYVRMKTITLKHHAEILVGGTLLRFEDAALNLPGAIPEGAGMLSTKTQGWQTLKPTDLKASFVIVESQGSGRRFYLDSSELWLGRGGTAIELPDDLLLEAKHARIFKDAKGNWSIADEGSHNGVWLRIDRHSLECGDEFQLGEQRFLFEG